MKEIIIDLRSLVEPGDGSEEGSDFTEWGDMPERIYIEEAILNLKGKVARVRVSQVRRWERG